MFKVLNSHMRLVALALHSADTEHFITAERSVSLSWSSQHQLTIRLTLTMC